MDYQTLTAQSALNAAVEKEEYLLVSILNPSIQIDGNQWCVLYGTDLQSGVCSFGDSPYLAVLDFNKNWKKALPIKNAPLAK